MNAGWERDECMEKEKETCQVKAFLAYWSLQPWGLRSWKGVRAECSTKAYADGCIKMVQLDAYYSPVICSRWISAWDLLGYMQASQKSLCYPSLPIRQGCLGTNRFGNSTAFSPLEGPPGSEMEPCHKLAISSAHSFLFLTCSARRQSAPGITGSIIMRQWKERNRGKWNFDGNYTGRVLPACAGLRSGWWEIPPRSVWMSPAPSSLLLPPPESVGNGLYSCVGVITLYHL